MIHLPLTAQPELGDDIEVFGGPANGRVTKFTGAELIYQEAERKHLYRIACIEHMLTGEELWVYRYEDYD